MDDAFALRLRYARLNNLFKFLNSVRFKEAKEEEREKSWELIINLLFGKLTHCRWEGLTTKFVPPNDFELGLNTSRFLGRFSTKIVTETN